MISIGITLRLEYLQVVGERDSHLVVCVPVPHVAVQVDLVHGVDGARMDGEVAVGLARRRQEAGSALAHVELCEHQLGPVAGGRWTLRECSIYRLSIKCAYDVSVPG